MTRNAIQFQPGLSLVEFQARFGREAQCIQALSRSRWPLGFECPECGSLRGHALKARPLMQCAVCRHQVSVTAGTIFHSTKLPLRIWFLAMHLLSQAKHSVSGLELSRQLGVSQTTAWALKHKLMQVMMEPERKHSRCLPLDRQPAPPAVSRRIPVALQPSLRPGQPSSTPTSRRRQNPAHARQVPLFG